MNDVLLRLLRAARGNGVRISVAEAIDAFHTVDAIGYDDRQALKDSLSLTLAKTVEEKILFEDCFDLYFRREAMARQTAGREGFSEHDPDGMQGQGGGEIS